MTKLYSIIVCLLISCTLLAQGSDRRIKAINEQYRLGEQLLLEKNYKAALRAFDKVLKLNSDHIASYRASGVCYELLGNHPKALSSYFNVLSRDPYFSRTIYYEIARTYYRLGEYRDALDYFSQFAGLQNLDNENFGLAVEGEHAKELDYLNELAQSMLACQISVDSIQYLNIEKVNNIGAPINTKADEYFPSISNATDLMFFNRRKDKNADENLFSSVFKNGEWQEAQSNANFNTKHNEGMATLVKSGRYMYFSACGRSDVMGTCDIWEAKVDGKKINKIKPTKGYLNSETWDSQASVSCDGNVIFFASRREGGYGSTDIWMSEKEPDGTWAEPTNLGPQINTASDEEAPFITSDGRTLYFSSRGHFGMGEQDIYYSKLQRNGKWTKARNLGQPVNSSARELGFFLSSDGKKGYFASDREGGAGGMDIYEFELPNKLLSTPTTYIEGYVKNALDKLPVRPATIQIPGRDPIEVDERGRFFICYPANKILEVEAEAPNYRPYENQFEIPFSDNTSFHKIELMLQFDMPAFDSAEPEIGNLENRPDSLPPPRKKEAVELRRISTINLYYKTNEKSLNISNKDRLDRFLKTFDQSKIVKVEIIGFADYVGSDMDNMKLSRERAEMVAEFIQRRDIEVNKFYMEAKGEVNDRENTAENRRVDVIIHTKLN
ncbi:MAG: OmpA family protein [Bacteroidota bacterium]